MGQKHRGDTICKWHGPHAGLKQEELLASPEQVGLAAGPLFVRPTWVVDVKEGPCAS